MRRSAEVTARVEGRREELFAILVDYASYADWLPGIDSFWVLAREGDVTLAEVRAPRYKKHAVNLELIDSAPHSVTIRQIDGQARSAITGRWTLAETEKGHDAPSVVVSARLSLQTPMLALTSRQRLRAALRAGLDALGARQRFLASCRPEPEASKQKLLELVRKADGLELWYLGETYFLPRSRGGS